MHPNGAQYDEIELLAARVNLGQGWKFVVKPVDGKACVQALCNGAHGAGGFDCDNFMAPSSEPRSIPSCASANVENA